MDTQELLSLYTQQQRINIEIPGARKEILPHVTRFVRPAPGMNFIQFSRLDEANADAVITEQVAYFSPMEQPFTWKVYEADTPADLGARLTSHGFVADEESPVMVLDLQAAPASLLEPITAQVRLLVQREQLNDVIGIEEQVWGGNFSWIKERLGAHLRIPGYLSVYVAYLEGRPSCCGWTYFHPNSTFASLMGGSTLAAVRGQGLYTAVLAVRMQEAIRRNYRFLLIEPTAMSQPIVSRHGFRLLTRFWDYEWQGQ